jgi:hypothetical protein
MNCVKGAVLTIACTTLVAGCVSLAPGADQVRITKNGQDVAACTAVGNIKVPVNAQGTVDIANAERQFRNQTIGLGGNVALVTYGPISAPSEGIAYHCS